MILRSDKVQVDLLFVLSKYLEVWVQIRCWDGLSDPQFKHKEIIQQFLNKILYVNYWILTKMKKHEFQPRRQDVRLMFNEPETNVRLSIGHSSRLLLNIVAISWFLLVDKESW